MISATTGAAARALSVSGSWLVLLASVGALAVLAALDASAVAAVDLSPDKWFVVAAILVLQGYLVLAPGSGEAGG